MDVFDSTTNYFIFHVSFSTRIITIFQDCPKALLHGDSLIYFIMFSNIKWSNFIFFNYKIDHNSISHIN